MCVRIKMPQQVQLTVQQGGREGGKGAWLLFSPWYLLLPGVFPLLSSCCLWRLAVSELPGKFIFVFNNKSQDVAAATAKQQ